MRCGFATLLLLLAVSPAVADDGDPACRHKITVNGEARAERAPDYAEVTVGVEATAKDVAEALDAASRGAKGIIDLAGKYGIPSNDIWTASVELKDHYDRIHLPDGSEQSKKSGYSAENHITVRLSDTAKLGEFLRDIIPVGANKIEDIRFALKDPDAFVASLETSAAQNARARAQAIASSLGTRLGLLCALTTAGGFDRNQVQSFRFSGGARMDKLPSPVVPVVAKPIEHQATVSATFALEP